MIKKETITRILITTFVLFFLISSIFLEVSFAAPQVEVTVNSTKSIGTNKFSIGFQLDGPDIRIWRDRSTLRELSQEANFKLIRFFEHRLGKPCTSWDERTKTGQWDWRDIDLLMERIFEIGAEPLIALGFVAYETRRLSSVPRGMSYDPDTGLPYPDQWAAYCAEWVRHFKEKGFPVRYYEMINEAYHYFDWPATQPKLSYFMDLYNAAAKAMRAVNNNVMIGNDACILKSVLDYFISHGENLDFLSYHAYGTSSLSTSDAEIFNNAETLYIGESRTVYGVEKTRELYKQARGKDLPVIHAENNLNFHFTEGTDPRIQKMQGAVYHALTFRTSILNGYFHNSYFHFASSENSNKYSSSGGLGFGMVNSDNNQPWYPYYAHQLVGTNLDTGDDLVESNSNSDDIRTVAWINENKLNLLLICKVDQERTVYLNGLTGQLDYYKLDNSISWKTPRIQSGSIYADNPLTINGYTVMLLQIDISIATPPTLPPTEIDDAFFEDSFESGTFDAWTSTRRTSGETTNVEYYAAYIGNYGARFATNGNGGYEKAYVYERVETPLNVVSTQGYYCISQDGLTDNNDRIKLVEYRAGSTIVAAAGLWIRSGRLYWWMETRNGASYVETLNSPVTIDVSKWFKLELQWKNDGTNGGGSLWINGERVYEIANSDTNNYGGCSQINIGIAEAYNTASTTLYLDEIRILNNP